MLLPRCHSSTEQGCAQNKQHDVQSNLASFWILRDKRTFLTDDLLLLRDHSCDLIIEYTSFWHFWWILIVIACSWFSFTTFVNWDSSSISPYLMIAGRAAWTFTFSSLDDSARLQITHTSADIATGWNWNLYHPFRETNSLNTEANNLWI